jgi:enoyl-CoA hydratase/carnithine racemase
LGECYCPFAAERKFFHRDWTCGRVAKLERPTAVTPSAPVLVESEPPIVTITLNRPRRANCINAEMTALIDDAVRAAEADDRIRCLLLTATGSVFCGGSDLRDVLENGPESINLPAHGFAGLSQRQRALPLVAAVNGAARAGGCEIAFAADVVIAAGSATFGFPEVQHGVIAGGGGAIRLARWLPAPLVHQLLLVGDVIDAERAHQLGLVGAVVGDEQLISTAWAAAVRIAAASPDAIRITRELVAEATGVELAWAANARAVDKIVASPDFAEGLAAFCEARSPVWPEPGRRQKEMQ